MKRILLFVLMCIVTALQLWAVDDFELTKNETYYPVRGCTYTVSNLSPGDLASALTNENGYAYNILVNNSGFNDEWTSVSFSIKPTSTLSIADLQALENIGVKITAIDLSGVTLDSGASTSDIKSNANNLLLPNGFSVSDLQNINRTNNPNLKVVGSITTHENETVPYVYPSNYSDQSLQNTVDEQTKDIKELAVYSFESNNVAAFKTAFSSAEGMNNFDKLSMAGTLGDYDLSKDHSNKTSRVFEQENLHYFDFTGATFDDCTITYKYGEQQQTKTVVSNALYYLSSYNVFTCKLPTGNTEIPPTTFYTNNGGWSSPICEITIPEKNTELSIPGYDTIGDYAFYGAVISNLLLPSSLTLVGDYAFATCPNLYNVEMEGLKATCHFGNNVFELCKALQHVSLSEKVENIGDYMFNQCVKLESIRIPSTCKTIGSYAFQFCFDLHQVTIPEGVELIKLNAFEGAGLTDLYIMATSIDKIPKIYAMSPTGDGPSTFSYQRTTGNNTAPQEHRSEMGEGSTVHYDEAMTWYQEEQSGAAGLGSGNCLTALHYPESMKPFYEAIDVTKFYTSEQLATIPLQTLQSGIKNYYTPAEYVAMVPEAENRRNYVQHELDNMKLNGTTPAYDFGVDEEGKSLYKYLPQSYAVDAFEYGDDPVIGPDADGRYYPNQHDYWIRMAAGATSTQAGGVGGEEVASAWGWRQFPLSSSVESIGETPFEKKYDDTWYTMAFPWRMIDNQLFSAFNQKCEIVEFVGAEVLENDNPNTENVVEYSLVFHFDDVAATYYMDHEDKFYKRELDEIRQITSNGVTFNKNFYKYTLLTGKDGNETTTVITDPYPYNPDNASDTDREMHVKYLSIENIMVLAGHPYMIHPSIGASPGNPVKVYINGVKKIEPGKGLYEDYATLEDVAWAQRYEHPVTSNEKGERDITAWTNPETGVGGKYYFIGNINDAVETDGVSDEGKKDLPKGCYYLGLPDGKVYPKYFKRKSVGSKLWSQYSAIIIPDADALANVEGLNGMTVSTPSGGQAKGATMTIGEWDFDESQIITEHGITTVIKEALEKDPSTPIVHMNVVYNIKGQVVRADSGSVEGLPKGIYIVNGKKYLVK